MTRDERYKADMAHAVAELGAAVGIELSTISEINEHGPEVMERALPTLIRLLDSEVTHSVKYALFLVLSRHTPKLGADFHLSYYERLKPGSDEGGASLAWDFASCAEKELKAKHVDRVLRLVQDTSYGKAREMLVYGLRKFKRRRDDIIAVIRMLSDPDPAWRSGAQKALVKIGVEIPETANLAEMQEYRVALDTMVADHVAEGLVDETLGFEIGGLLPFFLGMVGRISEGLRNLMLSK